MKLRDERIKGDIKLGETRARKVRNGARIERRESTLGEKEKESKGGREREVK